MNEVTTCLVCNGELSQVMDLGFIVMKCASCSLLQNKHQDYKDYSQEHFVTESAAAEKLLPIVHKSRATVKLAKGDKVLDIGCADGALLGWYEKGIVTVGVDPSVPNIKDAITSHRADIALCDLFGASSLIKHFQNVGLKELKFKVITAVNVLQFVEHPLLFLRDCKKLLHDNGVLTIQVPYLGSLITEKKVSQFTKHTYSYFLVYALKAAVESVGLDLQGVEIQGSGELRVYATHPGFADFLSDDYARRSYLYSSSQLKLIEEVRLGLHDDFVYKTFESAVRESEVSRR